jgi:hypothetical protein
MRTADAPDLAGRDDDGRYVALFEECEHTLVVADRRRDQQAVGAFCHDPVDFGLRPADVLALLHDELRLVLARLVETAEQELRDQRVRLGVEHRDVYLAGGGQVPRCDVRRVAEVPDRGLDALPRLLADAGDAIDDPRDGHRRDARALGDVVQRRRCLAPPGPAFRGSGHCPGPPGRARF